MFGDTVRARVISFSAAFIALIALGSWISVPLPLIPVPFTLQTLFVLLAGAVMGRYAVIPLMLYMLLGAAGLPLFHNGLSGIGILLGPTGGYIIGFIPAALVVGLAYEQESGLLTGAGIVIATLVIYLFGVAWLAYSTGMALVAAVMVGMVPFLPGDAIKACAAYAIAEQLP
jgi:biotin transport system substrate-specific component